MWRSRRLFIAKVVPDVILHPLGKVVVLLLATGLLSAGIVGITRLELDFNYEMMTTAAANKLWQAIADATAELMRAGQVRLSCCPGILR